MKCPHCEYEYDWKYENGQIIESEPQMIHGDFFKLTKPVKRENLKIKVGWAMEKASIFGCPACSKVFIA